MLLHHYRIMATVVAVVALAAMPISAQSPDFQTGFTGSVATAAPGDTVTYTVDVANTTAGTTTHDLILDIYLPSGVPCDVNDYLADDADAVTAYNNLNNSVAVSDSIFDDTNTGVFFGVDGYCENFLLQPQNLDVGANVSGTVTYNAVIPALPLTAGNVHVDSTNLNADLNYGKAGCATGGDCHDHPCLGPRVSLTNTITAPVEMVNDGSGSPSEGCSALTGFTSGNIAFIQRGTCDFETKIFNAQTAGASAVIIGDTNDFTDSTTEPDDILNMACTNYCSETTITIPSVFVSYNDSEAIKTDLSTGVTASIGKKDIGNILTTKALIWESLSGPQTADDTNQDNNSSEVSTTVWTENIFADGFESDTPSAWTSTVGWTPKNGMNPARQNKKPARDRGIAMN